MTLLLAARGLRKTYGHGERAAHAVQDASLSLDAGEFRAIQGRSGSGKTTLLNLLAGLDTPDAGEIRFLGKDLISLGVRERLALRAEHLGLVFQEAALLPELRLWENVALATRIQGHRDKVARGRAHEALALLGIDHLSDRYPAEVSGGEAQRASVARALAKKPRIVLADEPTASLDHDNARAVADALRAHADGGAGVLVVTHDDVLAGAVDRVDRIENGVLRPGRRR